MFYAVRVAIHIRFLNLLPDYLPLTLVQFTVGSTTILGFSIVTSASITSCTASPRMPKATQRKSTGC